MTGGARAPGAGRALLAERVAGAAARVEQALADGAPTCAWRGPAPRSLVTTGIGSSEAHARHLARLAERSAGLPARFVATGELAAGPPRDAGGDALVVFSQGLSPNARHALREPEAWRHVVLVTGLPRPGEPGFDALDGERRGWLDRLAAAGAEQLVLGCGEERGTLARVQGPRLGYLAAWEIVRALARRLRLEPDALRIGEATLEGAQARAAADATACLADVAPPESFFARERPLLLLAADGYGELAGHAALKIAEWTLRPLPAVVDALALAHGPLQGIFGRPASLIYLGRGAAASDAEWRCAVAGVLDPAHHALLVLEARLPEPFCVLEHEAMLDALLLDWLATSDVDPASWPGREREASLYERAPPPPPVATAAGRRSEPVQLAELTWPELARARAAGLDGALVPLGSTEQHGPHLPFATDTWIADALAERLARRLGGVLALPALPVGCASEHLEFPGTLHVAPATLASVLRDLLAALRDHGFARALVFSAHGGNAAPLRAMAEELADAARPMRLAVFADLDGVAALQAEASGREGVPAVAAGHHAGEFETSVVAGLRPGAVRADALAPGFVDPVDDPQALFHPSLRRQAADGVVGDPRPARAERAERYLAAWVERLADCYATELAGADRPT